MSTEVADRTRSSVVTVPPRSDPARADPARWSATLRWDPRLYQIGALASLLVYGIAWLDLEVRPDHAGAMLLTVLITQYLCTRIEGLPRFDPRSALISGLSLCLLLRTNWIELAVLAAVIAIASKFVLRVRGKHVFNPTNLAIVVMIAATGQIWVSPGQWGSTALFGFLLVCAGGLVVNRAARSDVTVVFLVAWSALVLGRSLWLGEPLAIPLHRLQNGALILFSFFMISDPRTTPSSRAGRVLFGVLVALGAGVMQFVLFRPNGLLWSLAVFSLAVPVIDRVLPGRRYDWRAPRAADAASPFAMPPGSTTVTSTRPIHADGAEARDTGRIAPGTSTHGRTTAPTPVLAESTSARSISAARTAVVPPTGRSADTSCSATTTEARAGSGSPDRAIAIATRRPS